MFVTRVSFHHLFPASPSPFALNTLFRNGLRATRDSHHLETLIRSFFCSRVATRCRCYYAHTCNWRTRDYATLSSLLAQQSEGRSGVGLGTTSADTSGHNRPLQQPRHFGLGVFSVGYGTLRRPECGRNISLQPRSFCLQEFPRHIELIC